MMQEQFGFILKSIPQSFTDEQIKKAKRVIEYANEKHQQKIRKQKRKRKT